MVFKKKKIFEQQQKHKKLFLKRVLQLSCVSACIICLNVIKIIIPRAFLLVSSYFSSDTARCLILQLLMLGKHTNKRESKKLSNTCPFFFFFFLSSKLNEIMIFMSMMMTAMRKKMSKVTQGKEISLLFPNPKMNCQKFVFDIEPPFIQFLEHFKLIEMNFLCNKIQHIHPLNFYPLKSVVL